MFVFRDGLTIYEVAPARMRQPPRLLDHRYLRSIVAHLCSQPEDRWRVERLVDEVGGRPANPELLAERFIELIESGAVSFHERPIELGISPSVLPAESPIADFAGADLIERVSTWLAIEVIHERGISTARMEVEVVSGDGSERRGRLNSGGAWRTEGLTGQSCCVRFLEHEALMRRRLLRRGGSVPDAAQSRYRADILWVAGRDHQLSLSTGKAHRILLTQPRRPYCVSI